MKSRYNYRVYPTIQQKTLLSQLFGCTRVVWNDALNYCQDTKANGETYPGFNHLSKKFLKEAKRSDARNWLKDVSSIPLQSVQIVEKLAGKKSFQ